MNTKGMKFLAALAVLAMAFAAFAVVVPAEQDDATGGTASTVSTWNADRTVLTSVTATTDILTTTGSITPGKAYYFAENTTVIFPTITGNSSPVLLLIEEGKTVTISVESVPGAAMYFSALSVKKTTSGTNTIYTSATAAGTLFKSGDYLLLGVDYEETDGTNMGTCIGIGTATAAGTQKSLLATNSGVFHAASVGDDTNVTSANFMATGIWTGVLYNYNTEADPSEWTFTNFTGTVSSESTGTVNVLTLTKFTGKMTIASSGDKHATITEWDAGDVEIVKAPETAAAISSNIPLGSTLYVDATEPASGTPTTPISTLAEVITSDEHYNQGETATADFVNYGTISIKQTKDSSKVNGVGKLTLKDTMKNEGVINNLGIFVQSTNDDTINNKGRIVTTQLTTDEALTGAVPAWTNTGGSATITNNGTFTFKETTIATGVIFTNTSTGDVRNQTANNKIITGTISNDTYEFNQSATITGSATLIGTLQLNGVLIIDEGATLDITGNGKIVMANAQSVIINNGTIRAQSTAIEAGNIQNTAGFIENNGEFTITDPAAIVSQKTLVVGSGAGSAAFVKNYGTFTNAAGNMEIKQTGAFLNQASGIFEQNAALTLAAASSVVSNAGALVIDGVVNLSATTQITITDKAATVTINELALPKNGFDLKFINKVKTTGTNYVQIPSTYTGESDWKIVSGLLIGTYNSPGDDGKADYSYFIIGGNASVATKTYGEITGTYSLTVKGMTFIGDLIMQEKFKLAGSGATTDDLVVKGTFVMVSGNTEITGANSITVDGLAIANKAPMSGPTINATVFMVNENFNKIYYYTTFANAISMATEAGVNEVTAMGDNSIKTEVTIPAPMKVKNQGAMKITEDGKVIVAYGAELNNGATITVDGTLYVENARTGLTGATTATSIIADVKVVGTTDLMFTNLYAALDAAEAGDVVVITKDSGAVELTRNTTIKAGVTLDTNEKEFSTYNNTDEKNYKLTVNGTLMLYAAADFGSYDDVTLNGYIVSDDQRTYNTTGLTGAYFATEVANVDYYYIAGINNLGDITAAGVTTVDVYGKISAGDLAFAGTNAGAATVTFNDDVEITSITATNAKVVFAHGTQVNTKVTDGASTATLAGAVPSTANTDKLTIAIGDDFTVSGKFGKGTEKTHSFAVAGDAVIGELSAYDLKITGAATTTGKKAIDLDNTLVVTGTFTIGEKESLEAKYANVTGTLTSIGDSEITNVTIGSSSKAIAAAASVTGEVTATTVILYAGNTVDPAIVEDMKYNNFYIDGKLWFTVYSNGNVVLAKTLVPVENAIVNYNWSKGNVSIIGSGDDIGKITGNVTPDNDATKYDISVKYDIYNVTIKTDAGVKAVFINGIVMKSPASGDNLFELRAMEAGTYKVTYTLINGYEGTAQLYTADGTILKDNSFVLSGTTDTNVLLQLSGTEQIVTPEPITPEEKSEWTITTILLVILVILIAVMAVIVALRLNRS
ncbi:hypothetical protein PED39_04705 [Methanomassiliicoccales archaeon LGM-RCC1]|nr:hypothetical protein PED39_04705 [Methanomassiliicoccales archaeon LGM-RCC1]